MTESRPDLDPPAGCKYPDANVLIHGYATPIPRVPENIRNVSEREAMFFHTLNPRNYWQAWLADDAARTTLRLDRLARIERRERDRIALRAETFWDDDRRAEAEEIGARLALDPARSAERLRRTPHGCDWMIGRWELLAREVEQGRGWTEAHVALAHDLLGTPADFRAEPPGRGPSPADLAAREIAGLRARRAEVAEADALDRALAMADMGEASTPELRQLRRHESALHKRLRWTLHQLHVEPRHHRPNPNLAHLYQPEPEPQPAPPIAEPEPQPESETEIVPDPTSEPPAVAQEPAPARRPDPVALKALARRQARKRHADRLDR
ncbi:hypothetical protein TA3x_001434 [Tundrisphaera sp. TA3]|uniref:hypothetical protein n=1 Tax=Tundrisphaera sp. TA3 TaxID=3435775 RepID=UPI003EBD417A